MTTYQPPTPFVPADHTGQVVTFQPLIVDEEHLPLGSKYSFVVALLWGGDHAIGPGKPVRVANRRIASVLAPFVKLDGAKVRGRIVQTDGPDPQTPHKLWSLVPE